MESNQIERAEEIKSCIYSTLLDLNSKLKELYPSPEITADNEVLIFTHLFYHIKALENDVISQKVYNKFVDTCNINYGDVTKKIDHYYNQIKKLVDIITKNEITPNEFITMQGRLILAQTSWGETENNIKVIRSILVRYILQLYPKLSKSLDQDTTISFLSKEKCILCGEETEKLHRLKLNSGGYLCRYCLKKVNIGIGVDNGRLECMSLEEIKNRIDVVSKELNENSIRISKFQSTMQIGSLIWFDDNNKWFVLPKGTFSVTIDNRYVFKYSEIKAFEVIEDGATINKGSFGKALVGGVAFGVVGAVVGASSKHSKPVCTNLTIRITTNIKDRPVIHLNLIESAMNKGGVLYKQFRNTAEQIAQKIQNILEEESAKEPDILESTKTFSPADEIKKYKELLDMGAITQEEFNIKKNELLCIHIE